MVMASHPHSKFSSEHTQVRFTGDWSADSKLSSIQNGYWKDQFFSYFNESSERSKVPKRTALICRGYYARFKLCDHYLKRILDSFQDETIQIVSLGCGMDTTYFRLASEKKCSDKIGKYFELDFASVVQRKESIIAQHEMLQNLARDKLVLLEHDLRDLSTLHEKLKNSGLDFKKPTLFYSECVVNYLKPTESEAILSWITSNIPNCIWLAYEQCYPNDSFGKLMVQHFQRNGCPIQSIEENGDMESQQLQLERAGFQRSAVFNVWDNFAKLASPEEFSLVGENQQFDEYESFVVTCLHYSVRIGSNTTKVSAVISNFEPASRVPMLKIPPEGVLSVEMKSTFSTHCSVPAGDRIWVFGGTNKNGARLSGVTELILSIDSDFRQCGLTEKSVQFGESIESFERVHSAATFVPQLNSLYIFGGRRSPRAPCPAELICVKLNSGNDSVVSVSKVESRASGPCARWRHGLTHFVRNDAPSLFLFGGKTEKKVLGDLWMYNCVRNTWNSFNTNDPCPSARHSHSVCTHQDRDSIFVVGGMSSDTEICEDSLWEYQCNEERWINHSQLNKHARKVGTTTIAYKDELWILGGYGNDDSFQLKHFLTRINSTTNDARHYELSLDTDIFLPFGFSAHLVRQHNTDFITILGGGGNCFSFGTHYNSKCLLLKVSSLE